MPQPLGVHRIATRLGGEHFDLLLTVVPLTGAEISLHEEGDHNLQDARL